MLTYRNATMTLRPPRVAVVFQAHPERWHVTARRAIAELCQTWGGAGFILIAHHDGVVDDCLLDMAAEYDPDYVLALPTTLAEAESSDPGSVPFTDDDGRPLTPQERSRIIADDPTVRLPVDATLHARNLVARRCSPHRRKTEDVWEEETLWPEPTDNQRHLLSVTSLTSIDASAADPPCLSVPQDLSGAVGLAAAIPCGVHPDHAVQLGTSVDPDDDSAGGEMEGPGKETEVVRWLLGSLNTEDSPHLLRRFPGAATGVSPRLTAWTRTTVGTTPVRWARSRTHLVVVGDSAVDFCLALGWHRMYRTATWAPVTSFSAALGGTDPYLQMLAKHTHPRPSSLVKFHLTSCSKPTAASDDGRALDAQTIVDAVNELAARTEPRVGPADGGTDRRRRGAGVQTGPLPWGRWGRVHLAVLDRFSIQTPVPVDVAPDGTATMQASAPANVLGVPALENSPVLTWQVDLALEGHSLPGGRGLDGHELAVGDTDRWMTNTRIGAEAITFRADRDGMLGDGGPAELRLARPRYQVPSLARWASLLARQDGYTTRFSDAGRRAQVSADAWGSRTNLEKDLGGALRRALDAFQATEAKNRHAIYANDSPGGVILRGVGGLMTFAALTSVTGLPAAELRDRVDIIAATGGLMRGVIVQCSRCHTGTFVKVDELRQRNICPRCGHGDQLTRTAWRSPMDEPLWFYDLHPSVRELMDQNGHVPLLLAAHLRSGASSYDDVAEIEVVDQSGTATAEIDLLAHVDRQLMVAEAKVTDRLDSNSAKARKAAQKKALVARLLRADQVILATTQAAWQPATVGLIGEAVADLEWISSAPPKVRLICGLGSDKVSDDVV